MVPSAATQSGSRRQTARQAHGHPPQGASTASASINNELFLEPMMGTPLSFFLEKDVPDREKLIELITVRIFALHIVYAYVYGAAPCGANNLCSTCLYCA